MNGKFYCFSYYFSCSFKIDRASAGNVKRSKEEVDADPEKENDFGYTTSKWSINSHVLNRKHIFTPMDKIYDPNRNA